MGALTNPKCGNGYGGIIMGRSYIHIYHYIYWKSGGETSDIPQTIVG